jgi:hypothetical protein
MRIVAVKKARFTVAALADDDAIEALDFILEAPTDLKGSAAGMLALFSRYAEGGRQYLPTAVFHEANRQKGIWQFIKGRLRIFCFIDDGALVILTHGAIKKSQKADPSEIRHAARLKAQYLAAKNRNELRWEEWTNDR